MGRTGRAVVCAIVVTTLAGCWPVPGAGPDRRSHNPYEDAITAATAPALTQAWSVQVDSTPGASRVSDPVVSSAGIHVTASSDRDPYAVYAVSTDGDVIWQAGDCCATYGDFDVQVIGDRVAVPWYELAEVTRTRWFATDSGALLSEDEGRVDSARGASIASFAIRNGFSVGDYYEFRIIDLLDPSAVTSGNTGGHGTLTLGAARLYHAGEGALQTMPEASLGHGVRAFETTGPYEICLEDGVQTPVVCPTWATPTDGRLAGPAVLTEDESVIYAGTTVGTVYALDADTGVVLWTGSAGSSITEAPALAGGLLYVPTAGGDLAVFAAAGCGSTICAPAWSGATGSGITTQPAIGRDVVFTGSADGTVAAFPSQGCGASACNPIWTDHTGSHITGDPALTGGQLYVGTEDGRLIAYAPAE